MCLVQQLRKLNDSLDFRPQSLNLLQSQEETIEIKTFKEAPLRFLSLNIAFEQTLQLGERYEISRELESSRRK